MSNDMVILLLHLRRIYNSHFLETVEASHCAKVRWAELMKLDLS